MQTNKVIAQLGGGIYSVPDIAFLLRLPQAKVRRWLNEFWDTKLSGKYNQQYSWGEGRGKATNFYTLIEFYVFYQLRALKVSTRTIFAAHEEIAEQLKTPFPFASATLLTDGKHILYSLQDGITLKADKSKQITLHQMIREFYKKIEFSDAQLAQKYYPLGKNESIVVDPHHQFGQPVIANTNVLAETIYRFHKAGESVAALSILYDVQKKDIEASISLFENKAA